MRLVTVFILSLASVGAAAQDVGQAFMGALGRSNDNAREFAETDGQRWYRDAERGWFWYEDPPIEQDDDFVDQASTPSPAAALGELQGLQAEIEETKARAVMYPTEGNIRAWLELNRRIQSKATMFSDVAQRVVWTTPALDQSLVRPHSQEGLRAWTAARTEARSEAMREIASEYGLFFIFESDCTYCKQLAPYLLRFARAYDFKVVPITLDGGVLPEFPDARYQPSMRAKLDVQVTPALFLVNPEAGHVQPIAYGVISISELETRIMRFMRMDPGEMSFNVYANGGHEQ